MNNNNNGNKCGPGTAFFAPNHIDEFGQPRMHLPRNLYAEDVTAFQQAVQTPVLPPLPPTRAAQAWARLAGLGNRKAFTTKTTSGDLLKEMLQSHETGAPGKWANGVSVFDSVRTQKTLKVLSLEPLLHVNKAKTALMTSVANANILSNNMLRKLDDKANKVLEDLEDRHFHAEYAWLIKANNSDLQPVEQLFKILLLRKRWNMKVVTAKRQTTIHGKIENVAGLLMEERKKFQASMEQEQRKLMHFEGTPLPGVDKVSAARF